MPRFTIIHPWFRALGGAALLGLAAAAILFASGKPGTAETSAGADAPSPRKAEKVTLGFVETPRPGGGTSALSSARLTTTTPEVVRRAATLRLTGGLIPDEKSDVATNASGIVQEVLVDRGSFVEKGDVLARLDPADARNTLNEGLAVAEELKLRLGLESDTDRYVPENQPEVKTARAALALAEANHKRYTELLAKGVASQAQVDQTRSEYESAAERHHLAIHQARQLHQSYRTALTRLNTLRKAVADTTITAPFSGWVVEKCVSPGERVSTMPAGGAGGARIATLVKSDPLRLSLTVPQQNTASVRPGQKVTFQVDGFPGRVFEGAVRYIAPSVASETRSLTVEALVSNPDRALRPGLFATADLHLTSETTELYLPAEAVRRDGDVARVFVAVNGAARERVVSAGETAGGRVLISSGIQPADVVVRNATAAKDGVGI